MDRSTPEMDRMPHVALVGEQTAERPSKGREDKAHILSTRCVPGFTPISLSLRRIFFLFGFNYSFFIYSFIHSR